jgi:hypothetical protein
MYVIVSSGGKGYFIKLQTYKRFPNPLFAILHTLLKVMFI